MCIRDRKEVDELMEVKPAIIALDATSDLRPNGQTLDDFYHQIREKYPNQLLMADCSTIKEALHADELGSVSYTHLDVYKRQVPGRIFLSL